MVSLPYAEVERRSGRAGAVPRRPARDANLNWRLFAALVFNLAAWIALVKLVLHFL